MRLGSSWACLTAIGCGQERGRMRDFSQLLDALVYTRSRTAKLKLIGDYLKRTPDPDRGYALAALTGELNLPAVKPAAIRAIAEERVDPALLYMSRDYVGDMAETVSLLWPEPAGPAGRSRRRHACASPNVVERLACARPRRGAGRAREHARPSRRQRPLRPAQARHRRASHRHLGPAGQGRAGPGVRARRRCGRGGLARHRPALSADLRLGRRARGRSRPPRMSRSSAPSCSPIRSRRRGSRSTIMRAEWKWDGIRVQLVHAGGETRLYSRAGDDITGSFPDVAEAFGREGVLDGELLVKGEARAAERRRRELQRAPAAARPQDRLGAGCSATIRPSSGSTTSCSTARRICAALPLDRAPRAARGLRRRARSATGSTSPRLIEADGFRGARGDPRRRPRRLDRGRDAEAPRQPLCRRPPRRPLVQMEARSARRRLRADVRRARQRQALLLLFGLHVRLLERTAASCCRSARPISASPTRS